MDPATLLPGDNLLVLIYACHMRGDDISSMGTAVLSVTGTIGAQAKTLSPERRPDPFYPGWGRTSERLIILKELVESTT